MNGPIPILKSCSMVAAFCLIGFHLSSRAASPDPSAPPEITPASSILSESTYKLGPQDQLEMTIAEDPLPQSGASRLYVNALGEIFAPVSAGFEKKIRIQAQGLSLEELRKAIQEQLEKDYYHHATVEIRLIQARPDMKLAPEPGEVLFYGEIRGQIKLDPTRPMMLSKAVLLLGYSEFANLKRVRVYRPNPETGEQDILEVDLNAVLFKNQPDKDIPLQDGDRVETPERGFVL